MSSTAQQPHTPPLDNLLLASILDGIGEAIQIIDADWNCLYINQAAADLGGKIAREMQGRNVWEAFPEMVGSPLEEACRRAMREQVRIDLKFYFTPKGTWLEMHLHPSPQYLTLYATETTRRVHAETSGERMAEIEALNADMQRTIENASAINEKLILSDIRQHERTEIAESLNARLHRAMRESHHRIKNNLQVVSALVEIQMGEAGVATGDEHLQRINQHINALASIHDLLTQQVMNNADGDYLSTSVLLGRLIPMLQATSGGRSIRVEIADILLSTDKAAALSLLVSECISNAVKHSKGDVEVSLRVEGDRARLEVCDNGDGFAPDFEWSTAAHTGLSLIDSTARHDLRGDVHFDNHSGGGGRVTITFPIPLLIKSNADTAVVISVS
jgi:PAS domain S-box-containing protein